MELLLYMFVWFAVVSSCFVGFIIWLCLLLLWVVYVNSVVHYHYASIVC